MCVRVGGDVIFFGTEMLNKWRSVPALPPFPEFTVHQQAKDMPKGLGGSLSLSLKSFCTELFYFLIEPTALCSTEEYLSIRTKRD